MQRLRLRKPESRRLLKVFGVLALSAAAAPDVDQDQSKKDDRVDRKICHVLLRVALSGSADLLRELLIDLDLESGRTHGHRAQCPLEVAGLRHGVAALRNAGAHNQALRSRESCRIRHRHAVVEGESCLLYTSPSPR